MQLCRNKATLCGTVSLGEEKNIEIDNMKVSFTSETNVFKYLIQMANLMYVSKKNNIYKSGRVFISGGSDSLQGL